MATSACLCNLNVVDRGQALFFVDETTTFDSVHEHLLADTFFEGKLEFCYVVLDLLYRDAIVHAVVHGI